MLSPQQITSLQSANPPSGGAGVQNGQAMNDQQFQQWVGGSSSPSSSSTPQPTQMNPSPEAPGLMNGSNPIKDAIVGTAKNVASDISSNTQMAGNVATNGGTTQPTFGTSVGPALLGAAKSVTDIGGEVAKGAAGMVGDIIGSFIPQSVKDTYGQATQQLISGINDAYNAPATSPGEQQGKDQVHAVLNSIVQAAQNNPETAKTIGNAVAMLLAPSAVEGGIGAASKVGSVLSQGADIASNVAGTVKNTVQDTVQGVKNAVGGASKPVVDTLNPEVGQVTPDAARASAWKDIQPKATPSTKLAYAKQRNTAAQGVVTSGKLTPSTADAKLLDSYQKLYEDGTIKDGMTPQEKQAAVSQKAAQLNSQQKDFLATHDKAVNLNSTDVKGKATGLFDSLDATAKKSSMPFAKDASAKGAYDSAIDTFKAQLQTGGSAGTVKGATTLYKIDQALTSFDAEMKKFDAWGKTKTGEMTDTGMARQQAIRDVHTQVRNFIANNLPKNSPWTAIRLEESQMYQIGDRLAQRSADTVGSSKAGTVIKNNPVIKAGVNAAASVPVIGAGVHLIP